MSKKEVQFSWDTVLKKETKKRHDNFYSEFYEEFNRPPDENEFIEYSRFKDNKPLFPEAKGWRS